MQTVYCKQYKAVTFALALIKSELVKKIQFDEKLDCDFNDIDYCLQAQKAGYEIWYTPYAQAVHCESHTRKGMGMAGKKENYDYFKGKWMDVTNKIGLDLHEINTMIARKVTQ